MKFGTSGLRGLSKDLEGPASGVYATAFGRYLLETGRASSGDAILVGRDFRESSPRIADNCVNALSTLGFEVIDCGTVPTPALALYSLEMNAACLMVTGSHIPADRNGIKFYRRDGEIDKQDEEEISARAANISDVPVRENGLKLSADHSDKCRSHFLQRNCSLLPAGALSGLRVGVYQHSTVARDMLVAVLRHYGADVVPLGRSETFVPVDTEAVSPETIGCFKQWVREHQLDAIVSSDGDGDRPLMADEAGNPLRGDLLGLIVAEFLKAEVVVTPVTSNSGIERTGSFDVARTRVGSPFVIAAMQEAVDSGKNGVIGFEANGGVLTATDFTVNGRRLRALPTRDCFLPILSVLSQAAVLEHSLSEIALSYRLPVASADRLEDFPTVLSARLMAHLRENEINLANFLSPIGSAVRVSDLDGLRITLSDRRIIHFRPSGNAPEMRCYVEAETQNAADALLRAGLTHIRQWAAGVK